MPTYPAIKILSGQDDAVRAIVWWDGKHIRSTNSGILRQLKDPDCDIHGKVWSDGEAFFKVIPARFSNGYAYCRKITVDEKGAEV